MDVSFTGTQEGMTEAQHDGTRSTLAAYGKGILHHGDCIGADEDAHYIGEGLGYLMCVHPPINSSKRAFVTGAYKICEPKEYIPRNHDIVDEGSVLIATPKENQEILRSGTWATIRYAKKMKKKVIIIYPSGDTAIW